ncbi:winged helix-turn-helix transcriptional regulator [Secundilactobacillus malefermentans]|uniref:winged helix-turn-helix transcriptional regulator n=1 Tax=Secundilactobacillus malefermentans TaxID=176292 RepID=UPI0011C9AEEE|nr:helix-turn-helix domain-containing protein [Secundilactobacillus malefermentans]QEA32362.1 helix-turn-helix transcriptional regulator [Secundilactobacillus malefermentans]
MTNKKNYRIGVDVTLDVIDGKWKSSILCFLGQGPQRFGQMLRYITEISPKVLTQQLRELENDGLILRTDYEQNPPKVDYRLTKSGKSLRKLLIEMSLWGENQVNEWQKQGKSVTLQTYDHSGLVKFPSSII